MNKSVDVLIRKAKVSDMGFIKSSLTDSWEEHASNTPELLSKEALNRFDSEKFYLDCLNKNKGVILIAEVGGQCAGLIVSYFSNLSYFFRHRKTLYIDDVYVVEQFRRMGLARKLISEVEDYAKKMKVGRVDNRVYAYNLPMQNLLSQMGYSSPYATWVKLI